MLKNIFSKWSKNKYWWLIFIIMVIVVIARLVNLSWPDWQVFDEIYYNNFARDYLTHIYFFDVHPPLGKLFITFGEVIFSKSIIGWRIAEAIIGSTVVYLIYRLTDALFKNLLISIIALILSASSTMLLVESRLSLLNIFILFFLLISFIYFWQWTQKGNKNYFYLSMIFLSLSASVKWTALFTLGAYIVFILIDNKARTRLINDLNFSFALISIMCLVMPYLLVFSANIYQGDKFFKWHLESYNFHANLHGNHPYASVWWKWFIDVRPIWLDFHMTSEGNVLGIIEVENPLIIWLGLIALFFNTILVFFKKNSALVLVILAVVLNTLPWIFIKRESFFYHFLPILPFMIILLAFWLGFLWQELKLKYLVIAILICTIGFFIWYFPMITGIKIPYKGYSERIFLNSWR